MLLGIFVLSGCGGGLLDGSRLSLSIAPDHWPLVTLVAYDDGWGGGNERWIDIADGAYSTGLIASFDYATSGTLRLAYNPAPAGGCFEAEVTATGLKPNFWYQLKLMGKPGSPGSGLWSGASPDRLAGDLVTNEFLGRAGRWFDYQNFRIVDNFSNDTEYATLTAAQRDWVAGYLYMGGFLTDENGNFGPTIVHGNRSFHITGKTGQEGLIYTTGGSIGTFSPVRTDSGGAVLATYDPSVPAAEATELWYEAEQDDPVTVPRYPAGLYDVVVMVTEESFHSGMGGFATFPNGGYWRTVLLSDWPDQANGTRIRFTIPEATALVKVGSVTTEWYRGGRRYLPRATVRIVDAATGDGLSGAMVTGIFGGVYQSGYLCEVTDADGVLVLDGPSKWMSIPGEQTFTVTKVSRDGYTWDGTPASG